MAGPGRRRTRADREPAGRGIRRGTEPLPSIPGITRCTSHSLATASAWPRAASGRAEALGLGMDADVLAVAEDRPRGYDVAGLLAGRLDAGGGRIGGPGRVVGREFPAERTSFRAHEPGNVVTAVAFSPDGTRLVTASYVGRTVRLWTPEGEKQADLPRVDCGVRALAFSRPMGPCWPWPAGTAIASLWGLAEARELGAVRANERGLQSIAFSGDGRNPRHRGHGRMRCASGMSPKPWSWAAAISWRPPRALEGDDSSSR